MDINNKWLKITENISNKNTDEEIITDSAKSIEFQEFDKKGLIYIPEDNKWINYNAQLSFKYVDMG